MRFVELGVCFVVVVEEGSEIFRILRVLVISKEENHFLQLFNNELCLSLIVVFCLCVKFGGGFFKFVSLGSLLTLRDNFLDSALSIRPFKVFEVSQKAHYVNELCLRVLYKIFVSNE